MAAFGTVNTGGRGSIFDVNGRHSIGKMATNGAVMPSGPPPELAAASRAAAASPAY